MSGRARKEPTKSASVSRIVSHFSRMAKVRKARYQRNTLPGSAGCTVVGGLRMATPSSGAKITATNQDTISAIATTANSENVYSPAELAAKPTDRKSTRLNSSHLGISYAVFCLKKKNKIN